MIKFRPMVFTICFIMIAADIFPQDNAQQPRASENDAELTIAGTEALYYQAMAVFSSDYQPAIPLSEDVQPIKSATGLAFQIKSRMDEFNPDQRNLLQKILARPNLSHSTVSPDGRFRVHYTTVGNNAVSAIDMDNNSIPDYVDEAVFSLVRSYNIEIEDLGFRPPPDDGGVDGPEWDIYITNVGGVYSWTNSETQLSSNPDRWTSYILVDNNYQHTPTTGVDGLRVSIAHEFHHMIQLGYNGRDDDDNGSFDDLFLMEMSSTYMEDLVYDDINDYYYYLTPLFNNTNVAFDHVDGIKEYGQCIFFHYLEARYQTAGLLREIWDGVVDLPALQALDIVFRNRESSLEEELALYYGWNAATGSRADIVQFYPEGDFYPEIVLDSSTEFKNDTTITSALRPQAARYYEFTRGDESVILIPVHVDWSEDARSDTTMLVLSEGISHPFYKSIGGNFSTRIIADRFLNWIGAALFRSGSGQTEIVTFNATKSNLSEDNLPGAFPNPLDLSTFSSTTIPFILNEPMLVKLAIFGSSGQLVFEQEQYFDGGFQMMDWNAQNMNGRQVSGGIYIYYLFGDGELINRNKIAVVR
ncbi:hypothetical protein BVY01_04570 [bacterium I07]|nr:hypothetical protein BVY01_04570 [bacterium I07]